MQLTYTALLGSFALASALPQAALPWSPPGPNDVRGPCPMLNTLSNHGLLPHSGYNFTHDVVVKALVDGVNFSPSLGTFLFNFAMLTNPDANATSFSLHQLATHGILEHDASLSRADAFYNPTQAFNQTIFDETKSYWKGDVIDLNEAATARKARAKTSVATNPSFEFTELAFGFAHGEVAALPLVFGSKTAGTAPKNLVTSFFENERLPTALGWVKPAVPISNLDLCQMTQRVISASGTTLEQAIGLLPCSGFDA